MLLGFERIDDVLNAAFLFAAAGKDAHQNSNQEFGDLAISEAEECYQNVIAVLSRSDLTGEQQQYLDKKMKYLRGLLDLSLTGKSGVEVALESLKQKPDLKNLWSPVTLERK